MRSTFRRIATIGLALLLCSSGLSGCAVYRGPLTQNPEQPLPEAALLEKVSALEYYDSIEIRFTDGSSGKRRFRAVESDRLLSFTGRGDSQEEYVESLDAISGIRSREVQPVRTLLAAGAVVGAVLIIKFIAECWSGCFE